VSSRGLLRFADARAARTPCEELALLETLDMGKPIGDSLNGRRRRRCAACAGRRGDRQGLRRGGADRPATSSDLVTREPLGVVGAIVPWNFPLLMAAWKIAPALAMGNSVVLKPSEKSPLTALRIAELAQRGRHARRRVQRGARLRPDAGEPLALHMDVDGLVFTGSTAVGKHLMQYAGART
jgi:4-guanidinobutyraldehyde dehydrogenase / NAD-dependent aldehyde dehydrogenase